MRRSYGIAAAAILSIVGCNAAVAAPDSAYLGVGGGALVPPDMSLDNNTKIGTETGWVAAGTAGLRWKGGWNLELEGAHRENDASLPGAGGKITSSSILVNALRNLDMGWKVIPYVGAGFGVVRVNYDLPVSNSDKKGDGYIWQLIGGATLPICKSLEMFADYRYFDTFDVDVDFAGVGVKDSYHGHEVMAGLRWSFWQAKSAPVAAPAPAPVAQPKDYVIYFEFDKANVTKAAGAVLDELKATTGGMAVDVVGHTDTSGATAYNLGLSEKRAKNTAKALGLRGVTVDSVSGHGESEPAVKTADGIKEPLNRRAVVTLKAALPTQ